jgi:hypothetical protein
MSDEDDNDQRSISEIIAKNVRPWNSFWSWKDKPSGEAGAARQILAAAGIECRDLISRGNEDPPDCEATIDGCPTGIEVTELVHQPTLERSLKALKQRASGKEPSKEEAYFVWERSDLLCDLQDRIDKKDQAKLKGGPYKRYILIILTNEMFLETEKVEQWLAGSTFQAKNVTDVLLGLSYDPHRGSYPVFSLRLCGSNAE